MRQLKLHKADSKSKINHINLELFPKKYFNKLARLSVWQTTKPSSRLRERSEQIDFFKNLKLLNLNKTGKLKNA